MAAEAGVPAAGVGYTPAEAAAELVSVESE